MKDDIYEDYTLSPSYTPAPAGAPGDESTGASIAPSSMPSSAPTTMDFSDFIDVLQARNVTAPEALEDRNSPQYLAALWVMTEDTYWLDNALEMSDPKVLQRFALATFYFAMGGDDWSRCGRDSPSCGDIEWLTNGDECDWLNVLCSSGVVEQMSFCKFAKKVF
jgi:hypothetical protein